MNEYNYERSITCNHNMPDCLRHSKLKSYKATCKHRHLKDIMISSRSTLPLRSFKNSNWYAPPCIHRKSTIPHLSNVSLRSSKLITGKHTRHSVDMHGPYGSQTATHVGCGVRRGGCPVGGDFGCLGPTEKSCNCIA